MKIAIIGTGAVGGYFGAKLADAGFDVSFLARGAQLQAIRNNGLRVKSILGDFQVKGVPATDKILELGWPDLILLGVKTWQISGIREDLAQILHANSLVLPLQNGVSARQELGFTTDEGKILGGVCRIISKIDAPGVINHFGATPSIVFGEYDKTFSERVKAVKSVFDTSGIDSRISKNIEVDIWKKFGFICIGGLMAVTRSTLGEIRELKETRTLLTDLVTEIYLLAGKAEIDLGTDFVNRTLAFIDGLPPETTFSLARDIWEGRPSELDYLSGTVVTLGEKHQFDTPINRFVYHVLKPLELKARTV